MFIFFSSACSDYALEGKDDQTQPFDSATQFDESGTSETADSDPVTVETGTCALDAASAGSHSVVEACAAEAPVVVTDPWNLDVAWDYNSGGTGVIVMPAIGNLTDDDGDGDVDTNDSPDVAFTEWSGNLTILAGVDGSVEVKLPGYNGNAGVTIADVDGDGTAEVIALSSTNTINAVAGDGTVLWRSSSIGGLASYPQPTVADLDNDGDAEVIFDNTVLDGATGTHLATLSAGLVTSWRTPVVADLDLDGTREILLGNVTYSPSGSRLWSNAGSGAGNFAAVANIDSDAEGEALFVSDSRMLVYDSDGTMIRSVTIPGSNPGPPSVADFDGDGAVEIAIPANNTISLYEMDGTRVWSSAMEDSSGLAGCSGYDVNGDGAYEVLFADELALRIYDGVTGTILYEDGTHDSQTLWEYPVVADLDNDGSAEIAVASNRYHGGALGVTVFAHVARGWPRSGLAWGTHDFAVTNLLEDGAVPTSETPSWLVHNVFRARPAVDSPGAQDLLVHLQEVCATGCGDGDTLQVSWQVSNQGGLTSEPTSVGLYGIFSGVERLLASEVVPAIDSGVSAEGGVFTLAAAEIVGSDGFIVRLEDVGAYECDRTNEEDYASVSVCP